MVGMQLLLTVGFVLLGMVDFVLGGALSRRNVSIPHDVSRGERIGCAEGQRGSRGGQVAFEFTGVALYYTALTIPRFTANVSVDGESRSISSIPDGNSNQPGQTQPQVSWTDLENRRHEVHISYSCADLASEGDTVDPPECVPFESLIYTEERLTTGPDYQQPDAATGPYITIQSSCPHSSNSHSSNSHSSNSQEQSTLQTYLHQRRSLEKRSLSKTKILIIALGISGGILFLFFLCFIQLWRARRKDRKMEREAAKLAAAGGGPIGAGAGAGIGGSGFDFKVAGSDASGTDSGRGSKVLQDPNGHFGAGREAGGYGPGYGYGQGQGPIGIGRPGGYSANSGYYTNGEYPSNGMDAEKGLPLPPPPAAGKRLKKSKYDTHKYYRSASDEINMAFMSPHLQPEPFSQGL